MKIRLIAVGPRQPDWVQQAYVEYAGRLPRECSLELQELALAPRSKKPDPKRAMADEAQRIGKAIISGSRVVALDERGKAWSTVQLSQRLADWLAGGQDLSLLIGGPDGLAPVVRDQADERWCLSPLTLPHGMVRVLTAEALYRAWSLLNNHPYHRA